MVLGTVELGLDYGINNKKGRPTLYQAYELLETAWECGIRELDTASAYGESERVIGKYQIDTGHFFSVDTKIRGSLNCDELETSLFSSCEKLKTDRLNVLYLHSFEQCKEKRVIDFLTNVKAQGYASQIGISIYEPREMEFILTNLPEIDVIQLPFNIFDNYRWQSDNLLKRAVSAGKTLYARSIFLQGLFFMDSSDSFVSSIGASQFIEDLGELSIESNMSISQLAFKYVQTVPEIFSIIVGCQDEEEVRKNIELEKKDIEIDLEIKNRLEDIAERVPPLVIDPRKWKR